MLDRTSGVRVALSSDPTLFPGRRDLGAKLSGSWSFLRYAVAVMNGNPLGDASLPGRDPNRAKDVVGTLEARGELSRWRATHVGFVFQFYNLIPSLTARENVALVTDIVTIQCRPKRRWRGWG